MDTKNLAELYDLEPMAWEPVVERLERGLTQAPGTGGPERHTCWVTTLNPDGSPHVTGLGMNWARGVWWFSTGRGSRKLRNLERDPRCAVAVAALEFDLVVEGVAAPVTDPDDVAWYARTAADDGWPCRVDETGLAITADFSAPSAGKPPWHVYTITPTAATAVGTVEPGGATRWTF
jgi:hypothetical protein